MKIETKFNIGDIVFYTTIGGDIQEVKILLIEIHKYGCIVYRIVKTDDENFTSCINTEANNLFSTYEEAKRTILKIQKDNLEIDIGRLIDEFANKFNINIENVKYENGELSFEEIKNDSVLES